MRRGFWFVAGAGAGVWGMTRARRAVEVLTPEGLEDRLSGLILGWRVLRDEVAEEAARREPALRERFGLPQSTLPAALVVDSAPARALAAPRAPEPGGTGLLTGASRPHRLTPPPA